MSIEAAFVGVLGRDAQVRVSKTDKKFLQLNVAVGSNDRTTWVNVLAFDAAVTSSPASCSRECASTAKAG